MPAGPHDALVGLAGPHDAPVVRGRIRGGRPGTGRLCLGGGADWFWCDLRVESDVSVLDGTDQCEDLPHREGFPLVSRGQVLT